jgi:hypothetical protein
LASKGSEQLFTKALHQLICRIHLMPWKYWHKWQTELMTENLLEVSKLKANPKIRERNHDGKISPLQKWMATGTISRFKME